ncbi:MAG TPA: hypothetical protein GX505_05545 [Clostridiales bacterium]|nr:hypothetical protein [Clostridiales bacterium]
MKPDMKMKMGPKSFSDIKLLEQEQQIDESPIHELCEYINLRLDCADFRLAAVLRCLYSYRHLLSEKMVALMEETVLNFRYFMDEPGEDNMCFWSENHQILFASEAYLAGQLYPKKVFANSFFTGRQLKIKAKEHILRWLKYRFLYGFSEWHSNTYYEEDIGALCLLIDFARDEEIQIKSKMILDLILLDMAMHSWHGLFCAASGRCYEKQKKYPLHQDVLDISQAVWGFKYKDEYDYSRISSGFLLMKNYDLPQVIRVVGKDRDTAVIQDSMGLDLSEIREEFNDLKDFSTTGLFLWGMESFTNPESIEITLDMFESWKMHNNSFLKDLNMVNKKILKRSGLLPLLVRILNPVTQGIAIQRANTYTYKTKDYMLSTAQAHHPGTFGDQQHIWQATLSPEVTVFTTHPASSAFDDIDRNFSPGYWVGNGIMPYSVQHENVHISIYDIRKRKGFMEKERINYTHAWFPTESFDEVEIEDRYLFGRLNGVYIMLAGRYPLQAHPQNSSEWIQRGKMTYWICEIGTDAQYNDFRTFVRELKAREILFNERTKTLIYKGKHQYEVIYGKGFTVDKQQITLEYPRLYSPYGHIPRKPEEIRIEWERHYLYLNFDKLIREHGTYM